MDSSSRRNHGDSNPIKSDPELVGLLKRLDKVNKYKTFDRWKSNFVSRLSTLVYENGIDPAEKICHAFAFVLKATIKCATKVTNHIEKGELSNEKKTVKASLALSELGNNLTTTVQKLEELIPSTDRDEKRMGFTKYHLGAVLIRHGFHQYFTMSQIEDAIEEIGRQLGNVADRQLHDLFAFYGNRFQKFCDIMADLNLYEIMKKCSQFAAAPEEEESSDEESMNIELIVETLEGTKTIRIVVEPSDTVEDFKNIIAQDIGIEFNKQVIKLNGKELSDNKSTLAKVGVKDGAITTVETRKIPITVNTHDGKEIKLLVDPDNDLGDIKRMVEPESGIPAANQKLFMNENMKELSKDHEKVKGAGIKPASALYMEPDSMSITAEMPDGKKHKVDVSPSDIAEIVKTKIQGQTGMAAAQQILKFNGKELPQGKQLKDVGIKNGDVIKVEASRVPVNVKTKDGNDVQIMVALTDTLGTIKKKIEAETGLSPGQQILAMNDEELRGDETTAVDHGIQGGSTLTLIPKSIKIRIEFPDGTKHNLEIDASDQNEDIKSKISKDLSPYLIASNGTIELNTDKVFGK